jgi:hypothetical protein
MNQELSALINALVTVKAKEEDARRHRISLEEEISKLLPGKDEGTVSDKSDCFKITVTRKFTRSLDSKVYSEEKTNIPPDLDPVVMTPKLDLKRLRAIESANPTLFAICQKFITVKPAKVAVKVTEVDNG